MSSIAIKTWARALGALLALLALAAAMPGARAADHPAPKVLHIFNWSDYTAPDLIAAFTRETGIKVTLDTYDSNETLLAKLRAGNPGYDIVVLSNDFVKIFIADHLLERIDAAHLPNFRNLDPQWRHRAWDPQAAYTVPWQWGTTSFTYDTQVYAGPVDSLGTLFKPPEVFRGKVGMFGSPSEVINLALLYLGHPLCDANKADLSQVEALLLAQRPFVMSYDSDLIIKRLVAGDLAMSEQWSGDAERARVQRPSLRYVYAKEGGIGWMDNLAIPAGAPDRANALAFINFMMNPVNAAAESNYTGYQNAVQGAAPYLMPALAGMPEFNPPPGYRIVFSPGCGEAVTRDFDRIWTAIRK
ncbi:extracellular solute-binding protein [Acidisoma sp. C75]